MVIASISDLSIDNNIIAPSYDKWLQSVKSEGTKLLSQIWPSRWLQIGFSAKTSLSKIFYYHTSSKKRTALKLIIYHLKEYEKTKGIKEH